MADDIKRLLIRLGISTADWETAVKRIKSDLEQMNRKAQADHATKMSASQREIEAEQKKQDQVRAQLRDIDEQITKVKLLMNLRAKDPQAVADLIVQEKLLLSVKQAQLDVLRQSPKYRDTDLSKIKEELQLEKSRLQYRQAQMRLTEFAAPPLPVVRPEADPTRQTRLGAQLSGIESQARLGELAELQEQQDRLLEKGNTTRKQYLRETQSIEQQAHQVRLAQIQQEMNARTAQLEKDVAGNRLSTDEEKIRTRIIKAETDVRLVEENRLYEARLRSAKAGTMGEERGFLSRIGGASGILTGGLGPELMAAVAAGELFEKVLEKISERLKEVFVSGGREQQLSALFERLTKRDGVDATSMLDKMRTATHGLVSDYQLMRIANNFMRSDAKATSDQIITLTGNVVNLSRATQAVSRGGGGGAGNQPLGVDRAVNALIESSLTGRTQMLGRAVGIDSRSLRLQGVPQSMDEATRKTLELNKAIDVTTKGLKELGEPPLTFAERMRQAEIATANFYGAIAIGMAKSSAFQSFLNGLGDITESLAIKAERLGTALGRTIGDSFIVLGPIVDIAVQQFKNLSSILDLIPKTATAMGSAVEYLIKLMGFDMQGQLSGTLGVMFSFHGILGSIAMGLTLAVMGLREFGSGVQLVGALLDALTNRSMKQATQALDDWKKRHDEIMQDTAKTLGKEFNFMQGKGTEAAVPGPAGPRGPTEESIQAAQRIAKLQLQIRRAQAKEELDITKEELANEQSLAQEAYNAGLISLQDFVSRERAIRERQHAARLQDIEEERSAQIQEINIEERTRLGVLDLQISKSRGESKTSGDESARRADDLARERATAGQEFVMRRTLANLAARKQTTDENIALMRFENQKDIELQKDALAARRSYTAELTTIAKAGLQERLAVIEDEFKTGELGVNDYLNLRRNAAQEEYEIAVQAAEERRRTTADNAKGEAQLQIDLVQAQIGREKQLSELSRKENEIRFQYTENRYNAEKGLLESALQLAPEPGQAGPMGNRTQLLTSALYASSDQLSALQKQLDDIVKSGGEFNDDWVKVKTSMYGALQYQIQMREELLKSRDVLVPIAGIFNSIGQNFGSFNRTLGETFTRASSTLDTMGAYRRTVQARRETLGADAVQGMTGNAFRDLGTGIRGLFHPSLQRHVMTDEEKRAAVVDKFSQALIGSGTTVAASTNRIQNAFDLATNTVRNFASALDNAITGISNTTRAGFIGPMPLESAAPDVHRIGTDLQPTVTSRLNDMISDQAKDAGKAVGDLSDSAKDASKSIGKEGGGKESFIDRLGGFKGALSSAMSGVSGIMSSIQGAHSAAGGALSVGMQGAAMGAQFGPWGAAIGATAGAITGGIVGNKRAQLQADMQAMDKSIQAVTLSLQNGSVKMGDAIKQLQAMRASAVTTFGGTKKGQKQLPAILQALDAQINQLKEQQRQTLADMHQQLANMAQDPALNEYLGSLEQIIQKYKDFSSAAAGNAQEVALANQYLVDSLQTYIRTEQKDLISAQVQAVQNAIQLLDLEKQRYDLIQQTNQQIFDIMGQGNVVAQRTQAQQHAEQVSQIEKSRDTQLHQLDMQIATTQARFDIEQKIFGLSQDRVTLESQLVTLQNQQTTLDMARIQAMSVIIDKMTSLNLANLTDVDKLFQALGLQMPAGTAGGTTTPALPRYRPAVFQGTISGSDPHSVWQYIGYNGQNDIYQRTNGSAAYAVVGPGGMYSKPGAYTGTLDTTVIPGSGGGGGTQPAPVTSSTTGAGVTTTATYSQVASTFTAAGLGATTGAPSTSGYQLESVKISNATTIHAMETARLNTQMKVVSMQKDASATDLARIQELRGLLNDIKAAGGTASTLEQMIASSYGQAGRQGYGGFTRTDL